MWHGASADHKRSAPGWRTPTELLAASTALQTSQPATKAQQFAGQEPKQSARYPADKGALSHHHRAALSIYRWCERKLRSRSTPQRSVKHVGSTILRTIIDIRIPPRARGDQSPPTGRGDAPRGPPHGAFAKSQADRCCRRAQQVVDLAGTAAAILNLDLVLARRDELQHAMWRPTFIGILLSPSRGW